jgi:hypothetical protein
VSGQHIVKDTEAAEDGDARRHQPFAACLVTREVSAIKNRHRMPCPAEDERRGGTTRPRPDDDDARLTHARMISGSMVRPRSGAQVGVGGRFGAPPIQFGSEVVAAATHWASCAPQEGEDETDHHEDDPHRPQDWDARNEADDHQYDAQQNHILSRCTDVWREYGRPR